MKWGPSDYHGLVGLLHETGGQPFIRLTLWCLLWGKGTRFGVSGEESGTVTEWSGVQVPGGLVSCPNTFFSMALGGGLEGMSASVSLLKERDPRESEGPLKLPWPMLGLASAPAPHTASPEFPAQHRTPPSKVSGVWSGHPYSGPWAEKRSLYSPQDLALQPPPPLSKAHSVRCLCAPHHCKPLPLPPLCLPMSSPTLAAPLSSHPPAMAPEDFFFLMRRNKLSHVVGS